VFSSVVVAFMRFAKKRSSSGAIASSSWDTMYHDGLVFHAAADTLASNAETLIGPCVAATTRASFAGKSDPKCFTTASVGKVMKPWLSTIGAVSAGGGGYAFPSSLTASPRSGPKAATYTRPATLGSMPASVMTTPAQE
jgi:hypothetical protein